MNIFTFLNFLGGLALFLFGMETMGHGLRKLSGGRLEGILERLTSNRFKALLLGAGITAVIQSSSATTVMVVGFVNSGIMKLSQVVGVIMGANIGTTVTSWLLSLTGIRGNNFFLQIIQPKNFSPILAFIGIIFLMMPRAKESRRTTGSILLGFAVLMFGMESMSGAMKPLAESPHIGEVLTYFSHPLLGLLAGLIITAIIQSSSASVGILQALSTTGILSYGAVLPIIMGQNIGTCVTALLAGIGSSKNARRASMIHLLFNIIGTAIFMSLFYILHALHPLSFMNEAASLAGIAVIHSVFNIFASVILLPFSHALVRLSKVLVKDGKDVEKEEDTVLRLLEPRFLGDPSYALIQAHEVLKALAEKTAVAFYHALQLVYEFNEEHFQLVKELESSVDLYEDRVGTYLLRISTENLNTADSNRLNMLLQCMNDFERISDHALNIAFLAQSKSQASYHFSDQAWKELKIYFDAAKDVFSRALAVFRDLDAKEAIQIEPLEQVIDHLNKELHLRHVSRLQKGLCTIGTGLIFMDLLSDIERISDHCSNIGVDIVSIHDNDFDTHQYLHRLRQGSFFERRYRDLSSTYALPTELVSEKELTEEEREELRHLSSALAREKGKPDLLENAE